MLATLSERGRIGIVVSFFLGLLKLNAKESFSYNGMQQIYCKIK